MTLNDLEPSERKRLARSSGLGAAFWVLALAVLAFVPVARKPFPEPDYPPVHLTLTSPVTAAAPVRQTAAAQEPVPQSETAAAPAEKAPSEPVKAAPAKAQTTVKPAPAKTSPAPAASSGGLGIPDFDVPVTSSNTSAGSAETLDFSSSRQTQNPVQTSVPPGGTLRSELEGSAATAAAGKTTGASVSSKTASSSQAGSASSATADALKGVEGAASTALSPGGSDGSSAAAGSASKYAETSTTSAGRVSSVAGLMFTEGPSRTLISPKDPRIKLTEPLAKLIESSREVTIQFKVLPDGTVPRSTITFTPSASLPDKVQDYLRDQFERWRFQNGTESGQASFSYSIKLE